jgi:hypothetical protein
VPCRNPDLGCRRWAALLAHLVLIGIVRHVVGTRRFFLAALVVQVVIEFV